MATGQKRVKDIGRSQSMPSGTTRREQKSSTLPANTRPIPMSSGEGFFSKLKRCLRIGSRGRYNISAIQQETLQVQQVGIQKISPMEPQTQRPVTRAASLRLARRAHEDKEDVILIHKAKISSGNGLFPPRGVGETIHEDSEQMVVHIVNGGTPSSMAECAVEGAAAADVEDIIEMDPGYETLDEIRRKVRLQALQKQQAALADHTVESVSKHSDLNEVKDSLPAGDNGLDSGITTPTTESPESGRDGQMNSVTSSMFSDSAFTEGSTQVDTIEPDEITLRSGPMHRLNSVPGDSSRKPHREEQRYSSDSVLTNQMQHDTDKELYANPQILFRKQSKMGQSKSVSASTIAVDAVQPVPNTLAAAGGGMGEKSVSEGNITPLRGQSVESDNVAPPLPDRRYLDYDFNREDDFTADCSTSTTLSACQDLSQSATHDSVTSISSIREVVSDTSCDVKSEGTQPCASSGPTNNVGDMKSGTIFSEPSTALVEESPCELTMIICEKKIFVTHEVVSSDGTELGADSTNQATVNDNTLHSCDDSTVAQTKLDEDLVSEIRENDSVQGGNKNILGHNDLCSEIQSVEEGTDLSLASQSEKYAEDGTCSPIDIQVLHDLSGSQTVVNEAEIAGCDETATDLNSDQSQVSSGQLADCSPQADSNVDTYSLEKCPCNTTGCSESSDPSSPQDNVVVLKLHESTHEDSLTGEEDRQGEGVSDATIARLEEKAAMLNMGACGTVTNSSKPSDKSLESEHATKVTNSGETIMGAEASISDDVKRNSSSSASGVELPAERPRTKKRKRKEEPIHMSFAELMTSDDVADDEYESDDDEDYGDVSKEETCPEEADGGSAETACTATLQPGPSTTAAAHRAFLESMRQLKDCGWYWGPLSYNEAMSKLQNKPDGSFLVRDSSSENYILSLSFTCMGSVCHTRIEHNKGVFSFWSQPDSHGRATIKEFIEQAVRFSHTGKFLYFLRPSGPGSPPIAIRLLYPVSRFCRVQSLQHMCRFLILRWVRRDHIDVLPVPEKVKNYLRENQYYVETLEED